MTYLCESVQVLQGLSVSVPRGGTYQQARSHSRLPVPGPPLQSPLHLLTEAQRVVVLAPAGLGLSLGLPRWRPHQERGSEAQALLLVLPQQQLGTLTQNHSSQMTVNSHTRNTC